MIALFSGTGAGDYELTGPAYFEQGWQPLRQNAVAALWRDGCLYSLSTLERQRNVSAPNDLIRRLSQHLLYCPLSLGIT
jgi:hypothetical protein